MAIRINIRMKIMAFFMVRSRGNCLTYFHNNPIQSFLGLAHKSLLQAELVIYKLV